ncbi:MAG: putative toxin-antitoxin system toxin component, PIN family [Pedobacter sp.]|nr:MAG: putative toxin-antitoxin system toxin component, PIN family [Pedobacter sp.]
MHLELSDVFLRAKFDRFASLQDRINLLGYLDRQLFLWPNSLETIKACRDPKDDKYLDLAVSCNASCIVTGDKDLLVLHPFKNIPIVTAAEFLNTFNSSLVLNEPQSIYASKG